ncbi:MAG: ABC transporter [Planctomycetes bacterium]|jgi:ABC-2 type transport system permease protein|nr:ABC transporter [Planctomycetota bacterium]
MSDTWTITKRELRSYFLSPIAYVVGALFLGIGAYMFFQIVFIEAGRAAEARMDAYFGRLPMFFLVLVPALAMRLWSEERKLGTIELLLTFPVRTGSLIMGKFLGALLFLSVLMLLTLIYPITLAALGDLDWGPVIGGYLGALLLAAAYLSLGLFVSSTTQDQIIALIVSVVVLLLLYYLPGIAAFFLPPALIDTVMLASPVVHFQSIARGVLDLSDVIYYVVFCAFFLFLNHVTIEVRKWAG